MPTITDWLMVIITGVYVIATIFICVYNGISAAAAKKQIQESQLQNTAMKEFNLYPYFKISYERNDEAFPHFYLNLVKSDDIAMNDPNELRKVITFNFENIGLGAAKNIYFEWVLADGTKTNCPVAQKMILCGTDNAVAYNACIYTNYEHSFDSSANLIIYYEDLMGTKYMQKILFTYSITRQVDNRTNIDFEVFEPQKI